MHKLSLNGKVDDLLLRPIVSNINTATYSLAKFLSKLLAPLRESEYTAKNTKNFVDNIKKENIQKGYKMVSFDVKSLFTNVPLDRTINIILKRIYDQAELQTFLTRSELKEMLLLCTKKIHFTFNGKTYIQTDGVAMGSPLGPVLADIFMIELEKSLLPELTSYISYWKRYVDDTICFIKIEYVDNILSVLNGFDNNIKFTVEEEKEGMLPFLDVLICRNDKSIETTVYRKSTNNDIYLNWKAFAPDTWKRETLKALVERAYTVCSTKDFLDKELKYLQKVFHENNDYPNYVIKQILQQSYDEHREQKLDMANTNLKLNDVVEKRNGNEENQHLLLVPYQGKKRDFGIKSMKKRMKTLLATNIRTKLAFTGSKLSTCFQVKDKTKFEHNHDIVYHGICPETDCSENYIGETAWRISERVKDHAGKDVHSHLFKHAVESGHKVLDVTNYSIIGKGYGNNIKKRKIAEALLIKEIKPTLNRQDQSIALRLFN